MFFCVCDGRPDEYPRFPKTLDVAKQHFKKYNLDALLISTIVPGLSAYNQAERERGMAPLSETLSRILLPHERFGTHLNLSRKTIDTNQEKHIFKAAGKILVKSLGRNCS